jgi:predicted metalloprotease with PDZ domain
VLPPIALFALLCQEPVEYELALRTAPALAVELRTVVPGAPSGETVFAVADEWGGVRAGGEDLVPVGAFGPDGRALALERLAPHTWAVRHEPGERVELRYRIDANEHQAAPDVGTNRRPIVNRGLFHTVGHLALFVPEHLEGGAERDVRLRWRGFEEAGWKVACSFGLPRDGRVEARSSLWSLQSALYMAGDLRLHELRPLGRPAVIALTGDRWRFREDDLVILTGVILETERRFFDDPGSDFYLVGLIPAGPELGPDSSSLGGTGLTQSFSMIMNPNAGLDDGGLSVAGLVTHEYFHEWNGQVIRRVDPEQLVYWFSEGFTNFYTRRLMLRAGLSEPEDYVASLNRALDTYFTSPVRNAPNARILADFWEDRHVKDLPYQRGDVAAMLVDHAIRAKSGGERSLDDLMRELVREARVDDQRVDTELLLAKFASHGGDELAATLRGVLVDGETAAIPPDLFAPCLTMETVTVRPFELGFDFDRSSAGGRVVGVVEGSAAHAAGLRDGQPLHHWSIHWDDGGQPVELVVEIDGEQGPVSYLPQGAALTVPRFTLVEGADCGAL